MIFDRGSENAFYRYPYRQQHVEICEILTKSYTFGTDPRLYHLGQLSDQSSEGCFAPCFDVKVTNFIYLKISSFHRPTKSIALRDMALP